MVPHLNTALSGHVNELEQRVLESMPAIERWFRLEWMEHTPPFYTSADLRNAGFKLAPVDTNLFPSTFNNLTAEVLPLAVQAAMAAVEKICPEAKNLLLVVDDARTGSTFYLQNLQCLGQVFSQAGLNVRLGTLQAQAPTPLRTPDGHELRLEPLQRQRGRVGLKDFDPCTVLLNNDLGAGVPRVLEHLHEQYLLPPLHAGWTTRRKSRHFQSYEEVAKKFAKLLGMDPWLIFPYHQPCGKVDANDAADVERVKAQVDAVLTRTRRKYKEYGINEKPFAVIKADNASARGILSVRDAKELDDADSLLRARSGCRADAPPPTEVFVQEGVPTYERINDAVAEPVVLMIDRYVVGGYYRVHAERGVDESLAAPGSRYVPLPFAGSTQLPRPGDAPGTSAPNRFYLYGVVSRLAMLAAAYELEATDPDAENYD